ncbi:unnamed protein product [Didymodactylos carnosus]|nr:unnamed protein product [Didymodactylos carnosus]CAF4453388.1 unnamed protein product [Didymodactylos carnosus]
MQGKEANIVLICMMYRNNEQLKNELNFIFNRQRVNVSITRAKQLCLLITSQTILNPPLSVFVQSNTRNAYTLLTNFIQKSKCIQLDNFGQIR